jgi:hypothetical protein
MARKVTGLERVLDVPSLAAVAYGEIASSIYFALGIVALEALGLTSWVLLAVGLLFLLVAASYAEGTAAIPETGGAAMFVQRAYNDQAGFLTGWVLFLDYVIVIALAALFAPHYLGTALGWDGIRDKPWDIVIAQMRYLETPAADLAETERKVALLKAGKLGKEPLMGAPASYWIDWAGRDGVAAARKLGRPVLVMRGERDFQVAEEDIAIWKKGLGGAHGARFLSLPGLNHLFIEGTGKPGPAEYETPGHVDARVIEALAAFADSPSVTR